MLSPIRPRPSFPTHGKSYSLFYDRAPRPIEYVPYNMSDYKKIKDQPVKLGGLGPVNLGTDAW